LSTKISIQDMLDDLRIEDGKPGCLGTFYRAYNTFFLGKDGILYDNWKYKLLKRISCPGCKNCIPYETFQEALATDTFMRPEHLVHMGTYQLSIVNQSRDWETGIIDDYDVTLVLVDTPEKP